MATSSWFKVFPTIQQPTINNRPFNLKALNPRTNLFKFPLASKIIVKKHLVNGCGDKARCGGTAYFNGSVHRAIRNLSYSISESCLKKEFSNFGQIAEVELIKDRESSKSKGFAFIQYTSQDDAMLALESMDDKNFNGRVISVELAKPSTKDIYYPRSSGRPVEDDPYY